jgi:nitrogen-specific signal transduction histidine kinase
MRKMAHDLRVGRERELEAERLRAFRETARRVAHELNNQLALVRGYGEMLADALEGEPGALAARVTRGAEAAAATIARLQRIVRFEEVTSAGQPMLDLDGSVDASSRHQAGWASTERSAITSSSAATARRRSR